MTYEVFRSNLIPLAPKSDVLNNSSMRFRDQAVERHDEWTAAAETLRPAIDIADIGIGVEADAAVQLR